jgi:hypothetical protein
VTTSKRLFTSRCKAGHDFKGLFYSDYIKSSTFCLNLDLLDSKDSFGLMLICSNMV